MQADRRSACLERSFCYRSSVMHAREEKILHIVVPADAAGERLDRHLATVLPTLSRSRIQSLIAEGRVKINGALSSRPGQKLKGGEHVMLVLPPPAPAEPEPEAIPLTILHEDAHLIVIDKPPGMVVHPAPGHERGTLVNALLHHCGASLSGIGGVRRPGIVHRLDQDTGGVMVVAKTDAAHKGLAAQFAEHGRDGRLLRRYHALVWGHPSLGRGTVEASIGRHPRDRLRMAVVPPEKGREAITHYRTLETFRDAQGRPLAALVECELETGRTHQIRVHMAHIRHPVMGDPLYATGFAASARRLPAAARAALSALGRQALHASILGFEHPVTGERMLFESPLPDDMARLLSALREAQGGGAEGEG